MLRLTAEIERLRSTHSTRTLRPAHGRDFTSNDALGLAGHPALGEAVKSAIDTYGIVGAGGSRLLRGHHPLHAALETQAAAFFNCEKALYFGSGFVANFALFTTLCGRHDAVVYDERAHASIKEGIHASHAARHKVRHNDLAQMEDALKRARRDGADSIWIAVESLTSMDGDFAPLAELEALARRYDSMLIVDEAHATGIYGPSGRGLSEGLANERMIAVHTCGKALGVAGALVCASASVIDYLINRARPFIYSTAPPPILAAALTRALQLVDEEPWRREQVQQMSQFAGETLKGVAGKGLRFAGSQIIPVILGTDARAMAIAENLQEAGFDVRAIRPPTVATGTSRLRLSINALHNENEITELATALGRALAENPS